MGTGSSRSREAVKTPDIQKAPEPNTQEILRVPQVEQQDPRVTEEVEEVVSVSENEVIERTRDLTQSVPNDDLSLDIDSIFSNMNSVVSDRTKIGQINDVGLGNGLDLREEIKPSVLPPVEITRLTNRTSNAFDGNVKTVHDLQAETQNDWNYRKESLDGFDPSKFKIVNKQRKTNNVQKITGGNFSTEEEPSLVWRLGLASPADAYSSLNNAPQKFVETRTQLPKPPSYDPTEEQLMAMIEKEYA
ncbi:uncharacterized protein LOC111620829 isoform X1 [Centruroides sculpturatus]|uniref:uncharacterized protein LOC111620829 isoform X1 n=1 Tax=Centruroides sculpturatus TaxID=218467 RepID=UPI000C6EEE86|nr:uncharacterized protein LOC111620829 isoform X1 [Centruroides sculpturatus]XP_023218591.1 uncharacterized protein LOC111620829 isoform X1 [Centruroides sculpturatus]